ncbi:fucose-specific lectin [Leptodontidium sp. MPI-SDFR-AT-0119]|nr:fucose-specific lectin [Leptodontidium sp. MPI-SDFR-AT-0119]
MANASVVANGTGIASVGDGNGVLRVYSVDIYGGIRETGYNGSGSTWWGGDKPIATGKIGSPLAVAASPGLKHIRLYYISTDFKLSELCYDADSSSKGWFPGELSGKGFQIAPYSQIAAAYLSTDQLKIRVYVQAPDNSIQEYSNDGSWYKDQNLGTSVPGSSISFISYGGNATSLRVYYQTPNLDLIEKAHENTGVWHTGEFSVKSAVPRAAISATVWTWSSGTGIRVYYTGANDLILEKANDGAWYDGAFRQLSVPGSRVGSLSWYASSTKAPEIRVYFQSGEQVTAVTEWKWQGGLGAWNIGHKALPPAAQ